MDDLEIKITLTYKITKNNLTLNSLLRGLELDRDEIMRNLLMAGRARYRVFEKAKYGLGV
jgi:hypothetical protein